MEVEISKGKITLKRPNARARNKAMIGAQINGEQNQVKFMELLLPLCVETHPFGTIPVADALGALDFEEYDKILLALTELMSGDEIKKKLNSSKEQSEE